MPTNPSPQVFCPICGKRVSYKGGVLNRHGYKIEFHQQTLNQCWGSYKSTENLLPQYLKQLESWMESTKKEFPAEWLEAAVLRVSPEEMKSDQYRSFRQYEAMRDVHESLSRKLAAVPQLARETES